MSSPETVLTFALPDFPRFLADRYVEGICPHCGFIVRQVNGEIEVQTLTSYFRMLAAISVMDAVAH